MKHIKLTILLLLCVTLFSCSTKQTITIKGEPQSVIYAPNMEKLAVIDNSGTAEVTISSDDYYAYLLSKKPNTNNYIPFALDYKTKSYNETYFLKYTGIGLTSLSCGIMLVGTIMALAGEEDVSGIIIGSGAAGTLLGVGLGWPADLRSQQTQYEYHYKYLSAQKTNDDINFLPITDNGERKELSTPKADSTPQEKSTISKSSVSNRKIKKKAATLQGTYSGTGKLYAGKVLVEEYTNIKVEVNRMGKNSAEIEVLENNSSYFGYKSQYKITNENNGYDLTLKEIPEATIKIDKKGNMNYNHPRVNIEGEIYTLKITAKKQD